jgi:hypothetical protein
MQNKAQITIALFSIIVIAASGGYILGKNRPVENQSTSVISSSSAISSTPNLTSSSSSQILVSSSSNEASKSVAIPVVETVPQEKVVQSNEPKTNPKKPCLPPEPTNFRCYSFSYYPIQLGGLQLNNFDLGFLQENIEDLANYYHDSIQPLMVSNDYYIHSNDVRKLDSKNYLINFYFQDYSFKLGNSGERLFSKTYKFTRINQHDGEFEELPNFNLQVLV